MFFSGRGGRVGVAYLFLGGRDHSAQAMTAFTEGLQFLVFFFFFIWNHQKRGFAFGCPLNPLQERVPTPKKDTQHARYFFGKDLRGRQIDPALGFPDRLRAESRPLKASGGAPGAESSSKRRVVVVRRSCRVPWPCSLCGPSIWCQELNQVPGNRRCLEVFGELDRLQMADFKPGRCKAKETTALPHW